MVLHQLWEEVRQLTWHHLPSALYWGSSNFWKDKLKSILPLNFFLKDSVLTWASSLSCAATWWCNLEKSKLGEIQLTSHETGKIKQTTEDLLLIKHFRTPQVIGSLFCYFVMNVNWFCNWPGQCALHLNVRGWWLLAAAWGCWGWALLSAYQLCGERERGGGTANNYYRIDSRNHPAMSPTALISGVLSSLCQTTEWTSKSYNNWSKNPAKETRVFKSILVNIRKSEKNINVRTEQTLRQI